MIRVEGADPWLLYHEGYYYYTATYSPYIFVCKSKTLQGMPRAEKKPVFTPSPGTMWSMGLWSPELHYYSKEDFGAEYEGWYLFIACCDGQNINHRMYVMKSDNGKPDGQYCHPVTGEPNLPLLVISEDDKTVNTDWCCGMTELRVNGGIYAMWPGETGRGTMDFHQHINIIKMKNPWTFTGTKGIICKPDYEWECHGFGLYPDGKIRPKVVEGGTAVYGDNNDIYVIYSGSGYWTPYYALGQLKYKGGDPLDIKSWIKQKEPILVQSYENGIYGCGHASYTTAPTGERLICYHAYLSPDRKGGRYAFVDTYRIENGSVIIGDGSGRPKPNGAVIKLGN